MRLSRSWWARCGRRFRTRARPRPRSLANCRAAIKALKDKVDALLPSDSPNRLEADNFLKALFGLSKMLETPSVAQYLTGLNKVESTTLGHLISFMHTFNLRFGTAKTPVQEQTYDQLYPLLVAVRDQAKAPSANPYTTSSGPQDPKAFSNYFSQMQYDPKHGVVPPHHRLHSLDGDGSEARHSLSCESPTEGRDLGHHSIRAMPDLPARCGPDSGTVRCRFWKGKNEHETGLSDDRPGDPGCLPERASPGGKQDGASPPGTSERGAGA